MKRIKLKPVQLLAIGFALIILVGSLLLMLPISQKTATSYTDCLFTSISATCVTGLVRVDTFLNWTLFGQIIIITMIQIGGLGFMTIGTMFSILLGKKIGLTNRERLKDAANVDSLSGLVKLTRQIIFGTLIFEAAGAILLATRFIPKMGLAQGIYYSIFHSISAFCNAGFDLMGKYDGAFASLVGWQNDVVVNVTIMLLVIIGGIGFIVWRDVMQFGFKFKKYSLHSKVVLCITSILLFGGAALFYAFESGNLLKNEPLGNQIMAAFFQSVTCRTAGFNTIDVSKLTPGSQFLSIFLMFIGGSPGSTAGGMKTTTIVVMALCLVSCFKKSKNINIFRRRLEADATRKAIAMFTMHFMLFFVSTIIIAISQPQFSLPDIMFECSSAVSTVGITTGITRSLNLLSQFVIMFLMYAGRIGGLSFVLSFSSSTPPATELPEGKISIG